MNICYCGAQASYPHAADCPYPLFRGSDAEGERWDRARDTLREELRAEPVDPLAFDEGAECENAARELGECDPEYADVDEAGQLALGVPGDQRAIPGLAAPRPEED